MNRVKGGKKSKTEKEAKRGFLRRELQYGRANLDKYTKKWSKMLNEISCDSLKKEVYSCWHSFNKAIDYKDLEISLLMDWIDEENHRYWHCLSSHNQMMEHLINFFYKGHTKIYNQLGTQVNRMIALWVRDYDMNRARTTSNEEYLDTMKYQMECNKKNEEYETVTKHFSTINEKTSKHKMVMAEVTYTLSIKFEQLHWKMKDFTFDYFAKTGKKQKIGAESMEKYECLQRDIEANQRSKERLEEYSQQLMKKYKDLADKSERKLDGMKKERDTLHECFLILRENLFIDKNSDISKRQLLSVTFNESFRKLEELAKKGSVMLKCLTSCRKYETASDKMLPYPKRMVPDKHEDSKNPNISTELELFWIRVGAINASRYTLNEERTYLKAENKKLRQKIHTYCKCFKCPALPPIPQRAGKIPYTEGREMMQKLNTHKKKRN